MALKNGGLTFSIEGTVVNSENYVKIKNVKCQCIFQQKIDVVI